MITGLKSGFMQCQLLGGSFPCFFWSDCMVAVGNWSECASMYFRTYSSASVRVNLCFRTCGNTHRERRGAHSTANSE